MARKGIAGTYADLVGNLPISSDAERRRLDVQKVVEALAGLELTDPAVQAFSNAVKDQAQHVGSTDSEVDVDGPDAGELQDTDSDKGDTWASGDVEGTGEALDERLTACLEQLRQDFDRGIVMIDENATREDYANALKADKTAGQQWATLEASLRADGAKLLKKAAAMPEGACLIGVHADGTPAIRQRSREIVNVVITKEVNFVLLPHAEAVQYVATQGGQYAKPVEIVRAVEAAGYRVPADSPNLQKKGLVAASEVVMGGNYVESKDGKWCSAVLKCPENTPDSVIVRVVVFVPYGRRTGVGNDFANRRDGFQGAVLWL